jgi:hypothetical protein
MSKYTSFIKLKHLIFSKRREYNSGRISGTTDKGIAIKARYLSTPGFR